MSTDRKNINRRAEAVRTRQNRIIVGYVQHIFPNVYARAEEFYEVLHVKYPEKRDLRKTDEYAWMKNYLLPHQPRNNDKQAETASLTGCDNMKLEIPLMTTEETLKKPIDMSSEMKIVVEAQPVDTQDLPVMTDEKMEIVVEAQPVDTQDLPVMTDEKMEIVVEAQPVVTQHLPMMSDETLQSMIRYLREDPDINDMFNDIEMFGNDETLLETELERELSSIFS